MRINSMHFETGKKYRIVIGNDALRFWNMTAEKIN